MAGNDEKKINYESFESTISKLNDLKNQMDDKKSKLININKFLTDEENWKGISRNYYCGIIEEQDKKFSEINEVLNNLTSALRDTLNSFDNIDKSTAKKYGVQGD
ncbi:MAG: hypothetical protein ACI398_06990 [Clostridium sp.]